MKKRAIKRKVNEHTSIEFNLLRGIVEVVVPHHCTFSHPIIHGKITVLFKRGTLLKIARILKNDA